VTQLERRKRTRLRLRLPVLLLRSESDALLWTETTDISNSGFYCSITQPLAPGERLACLIGLPIPQLSGSSESSDRLYLDAQVEAVRIVVNNRSGFGVGCRILEYRVIANNSIPSWAARELEQPTPEPVIEQPA
jgi:PilZ domain